MLLVDKFRLIKDYDKAFFYAKETIELGADKTPLGKFVHLWMAEIYNTTNKPDMARKHLEIALVLDDENLIQDNNWIEEAGLQDIFYSIREK